MNIGAWSVEVAEAAVDDYFRSDAAQAEIVAAAAGTVADHRAGAARHRQLHYVLLMLPPPLESAIGVCGAPDAHHRRHRQLQRYHRC